MEANSTGTGATKVWWMLYRLYNSIFSLSPSLSLLSPTSGSIRDMENKLPSDLETWRKSLYHGTYTEIWNRLGAVFELEGYDLWSHTQSNDPCQQIENLPAPGNYYFQRTKPLFSQDVIRWWPNVGVQHALRSKDKKDYIVRVMSVVGSDENHIRILRRLSSTFPDVLLATNHILPMVKEIFYEDIVFGIFPKLHCDLDSCMLPSEDPEVSVEDILYLIMQALEGIVYIHEKNIAHRDLFLQNFLVEWPPATRSKPTFTRPRVYLIDFECAVDFPEDSAPAERLSTELPLPEDQYKRVRAPELTRSPLSYCPFRLDIWQFGFPLIERFTSTGIPEIDNLWPTLVAEIPEERPSAREILDTLTNFVRATPSQSLQIMFDYDPIPR